MTSGYVRPSADDSSLRLHLNENTAGCSPRVLDALRQLGADAAAFYPDYRAVTTECAQHFGVDPDSLLLSNGLDESILAAAVAALALESPWERLFQPVGAVPRASLVPEPAFDMYGVFTRAVGGRVVTVAPLADLGFPLDALIDALSAETRLVFLTNPNNPSGLTVEQGDIERILEKTAGRAVVFVDEAYADFAGTTLVPLVPVYPHLIVGRTFAKAFGLAGLRAGALIGQPDLLEPLRRIMPPYSLNAFAAAGLRAALRDREYTAWYLQQVKESKALMYSTCTRLGLKYWPSAANFVLVRVGDRAVHVVGRLAERGIAIRDRSREPGCAGCVRITTGVVEHTEAAVAALEEALCDVAS